MNEGKWIVGTIEKALVLLGGVFLAGCHGTDLRIGTGRTNGEGGASGEFGGCGGGSFDVDGGDATSFWVELGFQLTPPTMIVKHADDHGLVELPPPPRVVVEDPRPATFPPLEIGVPVAHAEAPQEPENEPPPPTIPATTGGGSGGAGGSVDWTQVLLALVTLLGILAGGGAVAHRGRKRRRARRAACAEKPAPPPP